MGSQTLQMNQTSNTLRSNKNMTSRELAVMQVNSEVNEFLDLKSIPQKFDRASSVLPTQKTSQKMTPRQSRALSRKMIGSVE